MNWSQQNQPHSRHDLQPDQPEGRYTIPMCRRSLKAGPVSLSEKWATRPQIWVGDQGAGVGGDPSSSLFGGLVGAGCGGAARVGPGDGGAGVADGVAAAVLPGAGGIGFRRGRGGRSSAAGTVPVDACDGAG